MDESRLSDLSVLNIEKEFYENLYSEEQQWRSFIRWSTDRYNLFLDPHPSLYTPVRAVHKTRTMHLLPLCERVNLYGCAIMLTTQRGLGLSFFLFIRILSSAFCVIQHIMIATPLLKGFQQSVRRLTTRASTFAPPRFYHLSH